MEICRIKTFSSWIFNFYRVQKTVFTDYNGYKKRLHKKIGSKNRAKNKKRRWAELGVGQNWAYIIYTPFFMPNCAQRPTLPNGLYYQYYFNMFL